jgi:hypothetical protein
MKLPAAYETEVFINVNGDLAITQKDVDCTESVVVLNRDQARLVAAEIARLDAVDEAWRPEGSV